MSRRVVVTGVGSVTPVGIGIDNVWNSLVSCRSGIRTIDTFDTDGISSKIAGLVNESDQIYNPDDVMTPSDQRKVDKFIIYAMVAADQAIKDSGFSDFSEEEKRCISVVIGSGIGGVSRLYDTSVTLYTEGARWVSPFFIPSVLVNLASGHVAIKYGFGGCNYSVVSACASGTHSIGEAFRSIRDGYVDRAVAGGAEHAVCRLGVAGFASARALSTKYNDTPEKASRPWDKNRDGFVIGEGAGILTLETLESAKARGAKIYGEIVGYGASCDAYHITKPLPDAKAAAASMQNALKDAKLNFEEIDYINAHGTSTPAGDIAEVNAVRSVFGSYATKINISSTKSAMGHLLGAAGAVESIVCLKAIQEGVVPPTLNLDDIDDECLDMNLTPNVPQNRKIRYAMNNSFGFGGTNGTLIFKNFEE